MYCRSNEFVKLVSFIFEAQIVLQIPTRNKVVIMIKLIQGHYLVLLFYSGDFTLVSQKVKTTSFIHHHKFVFANKCNIRRPIL
jgi:hypothetical protein